MKLHTVLLALLLAIGASFAYFYVVHRNDVCSNMSDCCKAFREAVNDKYESAKMSLQNMFTSCSECKIGRTSE